MGASSAETSPLSLYLELEAGRLVGLESAARIALAWNALIVEVFAVVDPSVEINIELLDAVEGSLGFRARVEAICRVAGQKPIMTAGLAAVLGAFFLKPIDDAAEWFWPQVYEAVGQAFNATAAEIADLAKRVEIAQRDNVAALQKRELFVHLERDRAIVSAGAVLSHTEKPRLVVPRTEFVTRAGIVTVESVSAQNRTVERRIKVILLTAKLEPKQFMWRFADEEGEPFSAKMVDPDFIEGLQRHRTGVDMKIGLEMDVLVKSDEQLFGDRWVKGNQRITRVYSPQPTVSPSNDPQLPLYATGE